MPLLTALAKSVGPVAAKLLLDSLRNLKEGPNKLEKVADQLKTGESAITALNKIFGNDFLRVLNTTLGTAAHSEVSYEAGARDYIKMPIESEYSPIQVLRDELNVNLDRLTMLESASKQSHKNHFKGALRTWQGRYKEIAAESYSDSVKQDFAAMWEILDDKQQSFRDLYHKLSATSLGGVGTLLVISGACIATSTGVGVFTAISTFLFGIPFLTVGALVIPGALLVVLAAAKLKSKHAMSACVGLAYKVLDKAP